MPGTLLADTDAGAAKQDAALEFVVGDRQAHAFRRLGVELGRAA